MIYVFLANGFEEIEAITPIDMLLRCEKDVRIVGVGTLEEKSVKGSHGITVSADILENEIILDDNLEMIVLPGGMPGTLNLEKSENIQRAIDFCVGNNILIGAICAAPSILGKRGLLKGKKATCFPGYEEYLIAAEISSEPVVRDGNIITARGAGVSVQFGKALVSALLGEEKAENLCKTMKCV